MRRILLIGTSIALLLLPAAASAGVPARPSHGFLVVRNASGGGPNGHPVVTLVLQGFVVGLVPPRAEARIDIYHLPGAGLPAAHGLDVSPHTVRWRGHSGVEYRGSGFRFRAIGGWYRVVVRGSGVYLFAGGHGNVQLHGSSFDQGGDGSYSLNGRRFRSLPTLPVKLPLGRS
jgi:hypothetical protein